MFNFNNFLFLFFCLSYVSGFDLSKDWTVSCNYPSLCKEGLEFSIANNCLGVRACKAILDEFNPSCVPCVRDILDTSHHELVNGNYYQIYDSSVELHVTAC
jgi:hypothetical protein